MSTEVKNELRQAEGKTETVGILSDKDLSITTENGKTVIKGNVTVKVSNTNFIQYGIYVNEITKDGKENKCFSPMKKVMEEYKSIADVGEDEADKIRITGNFNLFTSKNGDAKVGYKTNFVHKDISKNFTPHSEFNELEVYVTKVYDEMDSEQNETGRVIVKGYVPTYNSIEEISLVAEEDIAEAVKETYKKGDTVAFNGRIENNRITVTREIPVAIGKPKIETKTTYKNDIIIEGASEAYADSKNEATQKKAFNDEAIAIAIEKKNAEVKEPSTSDKPSGNKKGRTLGF